MENSKINQFRVAEINNLVCVNDIDSMIDYISTENNLNYDAIAFQFKLYCIKNYSIKINEIINKQIITNKDIMNTIERLCYYNNIESIKILIDQLNIDEINNIFIRCCGKYNNDSINCLSIKIDLNIINKNLLYENLCISGNVNLLQSFINNKNELESNKKVYLYSSIKSNNIELVKWFINNYNYDYDSLYNAFYKSCFYGNLEVIQLFNIKIDSNFINNLIIDWYDNRIEVKYDVINFIEIKFNIG
jgi:hypothetical protein